MGFVAVHRESVGQLPSAGEVEADASVMFGKGARQCASGPPMLSNVIVGDFTKPSQFHTWNGARLRTLTFTHIRLQTRCRALVEGAAEYGVPFSDNSFELLHNGGETPHVTLTDGWSFETEARVKVSGVTVDKKKPTARPLGGSVCVGFLAFRSRPSAVARGGQNIVYPSRVGPPLRRNSIC